MTGRKSRRHRPDQPHRQRRKVMMVVPALIASLPMAALAEGQLPRPSSIVARECAQVTEVRVCAINHNTSTLLPYDPMPQLELEYRGYLTTADVDGVVVWISLNGRTGFYHMTRATNGSSSFVLWLGAPQSETPCIVGGAAGPDGPGTPTEPSEPRDTPPVCPPGTRGQPGDHSWAVVGPPDAQAQLFAAVRDTSGRPQDWRIEAAFVSVDGRRWDSKYGRNYRFRFAAPPEQLHF